MSLDPKISKQKKMGFWVLTSLVFGNMAGSGIFILPANLASIGSISLFSWIITACGAFFLALIFCRMSLLIPKSGGPYAYTQATFGNFIGFQTACSYWLQVWIGNAGIALALVGYLTVFFTPISKPILTCFSAIGVVWLLTFTNILGIRLTGYIQFITSLIKFLALALIGVAGWWYFHPEFLTQSYNIYSPSNFTALSHAASLTLWGFIGLESATVPADLVDNPTRNIPLATLVGTILAALVYVTTSAVMMGILPPQVLANSASPFAAAAQLIFGNFGKWFMAVGAIISCLGSLNGWILLQGQITLAASADKLFPKIFGKCNRFGMPALGLAVSSLFTSILLLLTRNASVVKQFDFIALMTVFVSVIPYFYTAIADLLVIGKPGRKTLIEKAHLGVALIAIIYSYWAIFGLGAESIFYGLILLLGMTPLYVFVKKSCLCS